MRASPPRSEPDTKVSGAGAADSPRVQATAAPGATAADGAPPSDSPLPAAAQRPEVMAGAAFAGAFVVARVLKRIFD